MPFDLFSLFIRYLSARYAFIITALLFCAVSTLFVSGIVYAETVSDRYYPDLSSDPQWLKLLHYRGNKSVIESQPFFLSPNGNHSPQEEYQSTLLAFSQAQFLSSEQAKYAVHCQYPARYLWLKQMLATDFGLSLESCGYFNRWKEENPADSVSLIYVTGYLGNPASFFGHLMMKFNQDNNLKKEVELLDVGINFGADADPDDNPLKYVTYGLFGGYNASFTNTNYYQHTNTYAENEQRELWEYELNLTEWEVSLLQAHLWELRDAVFDYYFLTENCSTAMANFVGIVLDESLLIEYQPWDMPINVINRLNMVLHPNKPFVKAIHQRPSKYTRIYQKYLLLSEEEQRWTLNINDDIAVLKQLDDSMLSLESRSKVLDILTEYSELIIVTESDEEELSKAKENKRLLLLARLSYEYELVDWSFKVALPPHKAQMPINIGTGFGYSDEQGGYVSLRGYAAYYDFLALDTARFKDSSITVLDTEIRKSDDSLWINKIELFNVAALNTNDVDLFPNDRVAWQVKATVEQKDLSCTHCLRPKLGGFVGLANKWQKALSIYIMTGAELDAAYFDDSQLQVPLGMLYTSSFGWKTHLQITPTWSHANNRVDLDYRWSNRISISNNSDIRVNLTHQVTTELGIYYNYYL